HQDEVNHVTFSRDSKYLASASDDNTVKLWTAQGKLLDTLIGHQSLVTHVTFSPDGKYLASASWDNTVKLWTAQGKLLDTLIGHQNWINHVTFSPDGKYLASASWDNTVKLWTAQGKLLDTLTGHQDEVNHVTFSPDGKYLASASDDNTVKLWTAQGKLLDTLTGHQDLVNHVTFSPDGKYLASASRDNTVKLWNFNREELLKYACNGLSDYLKNNPNVIVQERSLCGLEASPTVFILQGEKLAYNGNINGAIDNFKKALELDPSLDFDPNTKAKPIKAQFLVNEGYRLVFQGNFSQALASYKKAQELDPKLEIYANYWNALCWFGSLYNKAEKVMFACEKAVELEPEDGTIIDSRGLARALTGNTKGAIEDFEVFIAWTDDQEEKAQRQGWVDDLKNGKNPFTTEVLESLR
ncbi:MAG: hypothetical protein F6K56_37360, partial [Moorea sp. SIO3G5]|nr:hypothetical protein [Moorena sp. SIO3G5]